MRVKSARAATRAKSRLRRALSIVVADPARSVQTSLSVAHARVTILYSRVSYEPDSENPCLRRYANADRRSRFSRSVLGTIGRAPAAELGFRPWSIDPYNPTNAPTNKVCRGRKPPKSAKRRMAPSLNCSREPAGLASDLAPFSLCMSEPADLLRAAPLCGSDLRPASGRPRPKGARSDAIARSLSQDHSAATARLRGRHRRRRVRGDNWGTKRPPLGRPAFTS